MHDTVEGARVEIQEINQTDSLICKYKVYGDSFVTFPWADGALMKIHQRYENQEDRYFVSFVNAEYNKRAIIEMYAMYPGSDYIDVDNERVAIEVPGMQFVGFMLEFGEDIGCIVDKHGEDVEV